MDWYRRRPLFWWASWFISGILIFGYIGKNALWIILPIQGVLFAGFFLRKSDHFLMILLVSIMVLSGWVRHSATIRQPSQLISMLADNGSQVIYTGVVFSVDSTSQYSISLETQPVKIYQRFIRAQLVQVWIPKEASIPEPGDTLQCVGQFSRFSLPGNPGEFNYRYYQMRRQRFFQFRVRFPWEVRITEGEQSLFKAAVLSVRGRILRTFRRVLSPESAAFASAIILGQRDLMADSLVDIYSSLGLIHVTAVSGLHVGFVTLILMILAQLTRLKLPFRVVLVIIGLLFYSALVEFRPSVVRASIMASSFLIAYASQRRYDLLNIMGLAALIILIIQPLQVYQLGFQLSFLAVLGIVLVSQRINEVLEQGTISLSKMPGPVRWAAGMMIVSMAAFLGTLPVTAYHFRIIPVWGILFNLLVIPAVGFIVICLFTTLFASFIWIKFAAFYAALPDLVIRLLQGSLRMFDHLGFQALQVPHFPVILSILSYGVLLGVVLWKYSAVKRFFIYGAFAGMHLLIFIIPGPSEVLQVTFLDVGQGDATFIEAGHHRILVDAGDRNQEWDAGRDVIYPYFQYRGISHLNIVAISHFDSDHAGGVPALLQSIPIDEIWYAAQTTESDLFHEIDSLAGEIDIRMKPVAAGFDTSFGKLKVQTLFPGNKLLNNDPNDHSLVQRMKYGESSLLLTGDMGVDVEEILSVYGDNLKTDLLKVPHHGSTTSSSNQFIQNVQPEYAVISVAERNRFGLPSDEVLHRYEDAGAKLLLTSDVGAVVFQSDGNDWRRFHWR